MKGFTKNVLPSGSSHHLSEICSGFGDNFLICCFLIISALVNSLKCTNSHWKVMERIFGSVVSNAYQHELFSVLSQSCLQKKMPRVYFRIQVCTLKITVALPLRRKHSNCSCSRHVQQSSWWHIFWTGWTPQCIRIPRKGHVGLNGFQGCLCFSKSAVQSYFSFQESEFVYTARNFWLCCTCLSYGLYLKSSKCIIKRSGVAVA